MAVKVERLPNESFQELLSRFKSQVSDQNIHERVKQNSVYQKSSKRRREKEKERLKKIKEKQERQSSSGPAFF